MLQVKGRARVMDESAQEAARAPLYLEDFAPGFRFTGGTRQVSAEAITAFALEFDPQPFHTDAEAAKSTFFGGLAASGWHTAALTMRLLIESGLPIAGGFIGGSGEIAWPQPTRPGDILTVECEVLAVTPSRSRPERGTITLKMETLNQRREVVQVFTAKVLVLRRGTATA